MTFTSLHFTMLFPGDLFIGIKKTSFFPSYFQVRLLNSAFIICSFYTENTILNNKPWEIHTHTHTHTHTHISVTLNTTY